MADLANELQNPTFHFDSANEIVNISTFRQERATTQIEEISQAEFFQEVERLTTDRICNPLPPHILTLLPSIFRDAIEEAKTATDTTLELCFMSALSVANFAGMGHFNVSTGRNVTPINLYLMTLAESGERKSAVDNIFSKSLDFYHCTLAKEYDKKKRDYELDFLVWQKFSRQLEKIDVKFTQESRDDYRKQADLSMLQKPIEPQENMLFLNDFNIPSLKNLLHKNPLPTLSIRTNEGAALFLSDFFKKNASELMAMLNGLFDNEPVHVTRIERGHLTIKNKRLSMFIQVQPKVWEKTLKNNDLIQELGFTARMLICKPPNRKGTRMISEIEPIETRPILHQVEIFNEEIFKILNKKLPLMEVRKDDKKIEINELSPEIIQFSPDAYSEWLQFYNEVECELRIGGKFCSIHEFASKIANNCARIAATFHILNGGDESIRIDKKIMQGSIEISKWFLAEHFNCLNIKISNDETNALVLFRDLKEIVGNEIFEMTAKTTQKFTKNKIINLRLKRNYETPFKLLCDHYYVIKSNNKYILNPTYK